MSGDRDMPEHKPAEWFGELEANKNYYKARALRAEAKLKPLVKAAKAVLAEWDKHKENHPATMNALRDALRRSKGGSPR